MRDATKPKRRIFQFSLKKLFALVSALCVCFAWLGWRLHEKRLERAAAAEFLKFDVGARVRYKRSGPAWLRAVFGDDFFCSVSSVALRGENTTDAALAPLSHLPGLMDLSLEYTSVTDAGLAQLEPLDELRFLCIGVAPNLTDAGLVHLGRMAHLEILVVGEPAITDAGLRHLRGMQKLESLGLVGTSITDGGLLHLSSVTRLRILDVRGTKVTHTGAAQLQKLLPDCEILLQ